MNLFIGGIVFLLSRILFLLPDTDETQEFEHLHLFVMRNTFVFKNINSECDISAVNSDCLVIQ